MTTTEKTIDEYRARDAAYEAAYPGEVFLGYDRLVCADTRCAGMTLHGDIVSRPGLRTFYGMRNELFTKLSESNRQDMRDAYAPAETTCECGKVVL